MTPFLPRPRAVVTPPASLPPDPLPPEPLDAHLLVEGEARLLQGQQDLAAVVRLVRDEVTHPAHGRLPEQAHARFLAQGLREELLHAFPRLLEGLLQLRLLGPLALS